MNLRESISKNPRIGPLAASAVLLIGITLIVSQLTGRRVPKGHAQAFFSVDDGKTWFADSAANLPPFDKDGKQAVRAHVCRCADGTEFVNYLERFKPEAKRLLEEQSTSDASHGGIGNLAAVQSAYIGGREVKRPGDTKWVATSDFREAAQVMSVKCPNGGTDAAGVEP